MDHKLVHEQGLAVSVSQAPSADVKTCTSSLQVPDWEVKRYQGRDLLAETEGRVLREVVERVHDNGYVGLHWPIVERELVGADDFWRVTAYVATVPR